jgi:sporulation integral membrane protein YtvI
MPFLIAWCAACLIEPAGRYLRNKYGIKRTYSAALGTIFIFGGLGFLVFITGWRGALWLADVIKQLPERLSGLPLLFKAGEDRLYGFIVAAPPEFQEFLVSAVNKLNEGLTSLPSQLYSKLIGAFGAIVSSAPKTLFFIAASAIGTFFLSAGFDEAKAFLRRQIPQSISQRLTGASAEAAGAVKRWAGAELTLVGATFIQLTVFFLMLRVKNAVFAAAATALIDALPILGTGTVLIPWAIVETASGHLNRAAILLSAYLCVAIVRSLLEPKLLGEGSGPHPVMSLLAIWLGFRIAGVWGMVLFPIALLIIKRLHDSGYIKIWK